MKRLLILFLLTLSLSANAQNKKKLFFLLQAGSSTPTDEITAAPFSVDKNQRVGTPVAITCTVPTNIATTNYGWKIYNRSGALVDLAFVKNPSFNIDVIGAYTVELTVTTGTDHVVRTIEDAFYVHAARFDIGDADLVLDFSTNTDFYYSYTSVDKAGWKIALTGITSSAGHKIEFNNMASSDPANPVRIQVFGDTEVKGGASVFSTWWLSGTCSNIVVDGYKEDGTKGLTITNTGVGTNSQLLYHDGKFTGIQYFGVTMNHTTAAEGAALSMVGTTAGASVNSTNHLIDNIVIYDNIINNAGEEGMYLSHNNDALVSGYYAAQWANPLIAWNVITNTGRDGIQIGGAYGIRMHHNTIKNFGLDEDGGGQTNAVSWNGGSSGQFFKNSMQGGEVLENLQSGLRPWNVASGSVPLPSYSYSNVGINGAYSGWSSPSEPVGIYRQNLQDSGNPGPWNLKHFNNTYAIDKKVYEEYWHTNSFSSAADRLINNVFVYQTASAITNEYNQTGNLLTANAATTANITLSGVQTIDGVTTPAIVLVKNQTTQSQNGLYFPAAGAWTRSTSADSDGEIQYLQVKPTAGTVNANKIFYQSTATPTLGSSNIVFTERNPGKVINNLTRAVGAESDLLFTTYTNPTTADPNFKPTSLSSVAYSGSPTDLSASIPEITNPTDYEGYPLGDAFGAYSSFGLQAIAFTPVDASAATFSPALAVGTLTDFGGTITFEANKVGQLFWVVVADGATAPTIAQIKAGGYLASGTITDVGTADSYAISTLSSGTAYDLYGVFETVDFVTQASATKVDFTTTSDVVAPTISTFVINDANKDRIYFSSSEVITASTFAGFTVATPTKTISSVTINAGQTTGHYFTVSVAFSYGETPTLAYSGSGSNLQDLVGNALASFSATSITNNIAPAAQEAVTWVDGTNVTITTNSFVTTSTNNTARSNQIIPAASNGYIKYTWNIANRAGASGWKAGFIGATDARTAVNIKMTVNFLASNIDVYEGTTYKSTISGGTGINGSGVIHRWRVDRGTSKIYYETSTDDTNWTLRATYSGTVTGDLRFGFFGNETSKQVDNAYIQADYGLN